MKRNIKDWLLILILLLDDAAALVLVLLVLWFFKIRIPIYVAIIVALVLGGFIFIIHRAVIPSLHKKKVTGSEGMIGLECEVVERLAPTGIVRVEGEYWKAKSVDGDIGAGEKAEVTGLSRLTLEVKRKNDN